VADRHYWALIWTVKPGTEEAVREAFRNYGYPDHTVKDEEGNVRGKLIATQVFMKDNIVVRVVEAEGELPIIAQHMGRQPAIRELETKLDEYLEEPRDMSTPEGARDFFMKTSMELLVVRRHDDEQ
jgi:hypothetical protein